jgi:UPF0755 protein
MTRTRILLGAAAGLGLAGALAAAGGCWSLLNRPWAGRSGQPVTVVLEPGLSATAMLERLAQEGVIRHAALVGVWAELSGQARELHAGEYRFERAMSPLQVLGRLRRGEVVLHPVTLPEGLVLEEIALRLAQAGVGEVAPLVAAFRDPSPIRDLDPEAVDLEGYLFPDTYHFARGEAPASVAFRLVERFRDAIGEDYSRQAAIVGLDLRGAVTLASLIERETAVAAERGRVSRVFHNRLRSGMKLECDPTVLYAMRRAGLPLGRLSYRDLQLDSPWNTYRTTGLPAGPIANPGRDSLLAAVEPAPGDELFFVAAPGGGHRFSRTLADHLEAVAAWRSYSRSSR